MPTEAKKSAPTAAPSDDDVERERGVVLSRVNALVGAVVEVTKAAQQQPLRERLLSIGYPSYLPSLDQLALDLIDWQNRLQVETPPPPPVCPCGAPATTKDPWGGVDTCGKCGRELWAEYFERNPETYAYTLDGDDIDIAEFIGDNETLEGDDLLKICHLRPGEAIQYGGGAAAHFTLARVS